MIKSPSSCRHIDLCREVTPLSSGPSAASPQLVSQRKEVFLPHVTGDCDVLLGRQALLPGMGVLWAPKCSLGLLPYIKLRLWRNVYQGLSCDTSETRKPEGKLGPCIIFT